MSSFMNQSNKQEKQSSVDPMKMNHLNTVTQKKWYGRKSGAGHPQLQKKSNSDVSLVVQRKVKLNADEDPASIWSTVGGLVSTRYKRKQLLFSWAEDDVVRDYTDPQGLADDLDMYNRSGGALGRTRPPWASKLTEKFSQTYGGAWHRRHIIMSSLMRNAVYSVTNNNDETEAIDAYNGLTGGLLGTATTLAQAEANLVYLLHNNPANLVIDKGDWNSGIGSLAHNIEELLKRPADEIIEIYQNDKDKFFAMCLGGFQMSIQNAILDFWKSFLLENNPHSKEDLIDVLEMMYDNAAVDLMSTQDMPSHDDLTAKLLSLHGRFASAVETGDLKTLIDACSEYISLGTDVGAIVGDKVVKYSDVL